MGRSWFAERIRRAQVSGHPAIRWVYHRVRWIFRLVGRNLWFLGLGWVNSVRSVTRVDDGWVIAGWAYHRGTDFGPQPRFRAWLTRRGRRVELSAQSRYNMEARAAARAAEHDYALDAFEVLVPDEVLDALPPDQRWRLRVEIAGAGHRVRGRVDSVSRLGSAMVAGPERRADGRLVGPRIADATDQDRVVSRLDFVNASAPVVEVIGVSIDGDRVQIAVQDGVDLRAARWVAFGQTSAALHVDAKARVIEGSVPAWTTLERDPNGLRKAWLVEVDVAGSWTYLTVPAHLERPTVPGSSIAVRATRDRLLEVVQAPTRVVVDGVSLVAGDVAEVEIAGSWAGSESFALAFRSRFETIPIEITVDGDRFTGRAALALSRWGGPAKPPPLGAYALVALHRGRAWATSLDRAAGQLVPIVHATDEYRLRVVTVGRDQLALRFGPPRTEEEFGAWRQLQLREKYSLGDVEPIDAVYFESFFGRNATCNPMAIDAEIAQRHPELPRYWGVQDLSIVVPEGSTPLVRGTAEWWRIRSSARWVVTNEWLRANFIKQPFQTVMQTWHGSMYKQIGLDRAARGKSHLMIVDRERVKWDLFLSQAAETTPIIKSAYALDEQVIETGYPRNDELFRLDEATRRAWRARIGIPADTTVVMYAPTWREANQDEVELLNLEELGPALGDGYTLLRRGHVRSLSNATAARSTNVIDVSTYPQINHLLGVADVLVTDYSSMMFDFSVTGRPMIFYTPDIDDYTDTAIRGSYFDLQERAPGPVTREVREVVRLLRTFPEWTSEHRERYTAWQQRYNLLDDGSASRRAAEALLSFHERAHGPIGADVDTDAVLDSDTEGPPDENRLDLDDA